MVSVPSGVRYQFLVKLDKDAGAAYTIRAAANVVPQVITGYGVLQYSGNSTINTSTKNTFVAPATGYPALPTSAASMDYTGAPVGRNDTAKTLTTELDPWVDAPPFPARPPLTEADGNITMVILGMSRPSSTTWAANNTGLQGPLYEEGDPLIWPSVWKPAAEAMQNNSGPLAGSALINAKSVTILPNDTIVDVIMTVTGEQYVCLSRCCCRCANSASQPAAPDAQALQPVLGHWSGPGRVELQQRRRSCCRHARELQLCQPARPR